MDGFWNRADAASLERSSQKRRRARQKERIRSHQSEDCFESVEATGWRVKEGGKEWKGGKEKAGEDIGRVTGRTMRVCWQKSWEGTKVSR